MRSSEPDEALARADGLVVGLHGPDSETVTAFVRGQHRYDG